MTKITTFYYHGIVIDRNVIHAVLGNFFLLPFRFSKWFSTRGMRVDGARELWLTSSCAAPAAESWYRKRVAASLRLSNTIARKQRRDRRVRDARNFVRNFVTDFSIVSRQFWRLIRFDLFLSLNPTRRKTFVVVPFFSSFALLASDVTCENAPRETRLTRDRTVFSKAPHDYYWPEYTTQTTDWSMGMRTASCAVYSGSNRLWTVYRHLSSKSWYKKFMISTTFNRPWIKPTFTISSE